MTKKMNIKVNGIHCNGCVNKIKNSIDALNADAQTEVNIDNGQVKVVFNSEKAAVSDIKKKITDVGFSIESIEIE